MRLINDQIDKLYNMLEQNIEKSTIFIHFCCLDECSLACSDCFWWWINRRINNVKIMIEYITPKFNTIWSITYMPPLYLPSDSMKLWRWQVKITPNKTQIFLPNIYIWMFKFYLEVCHEDIELLFFLWATF